MPPLSAKGLHVTRITDNGGGESSATDIQDIADKLWQAADKLRGTVDAAEYKHVVLGLLFLKYISDSFESRRAQLEEELRREKIPEAQIPPLLESRDEYTANRVFWVLPDDRRSNTQDDWPKDQTTAGDNSMGAPVA